MATLETLMTTFPIGSQTTDTTRLEIDSGFLRFHRYPTPQDVANIGLIGFPKQFPLTGEFITAEFISQHLAAVIANIEMGGLIINPIICSKQEDYHDGMFMQKYFPVMVDRFPVVDVESIILMFPHTTMNNPMLNYTIPKEWISWDRNKINIIASTGLLAPQMTGSVYNAPLAIWTNNSYRPNSFTVTWKAGFENDKLPYNVWKLIVDMTALSILNDVGPLMFPLGSMSVGIDSVSQSSQSPGPTLLLQRLKSLQEQVNKTYNTILAYYGQTLNMSFAGI
jgi:hypothetical protein